MSRIANIVLLLVVSLLTVTPAVGEKLRRDPFKAPEEFSTQAVASSGNVLTLGGRPQIRGILLNAGESLVNLGGQIIGVGEEVDGYRLLEVGEEQAIFQHQGEIITLDLYPDEDDESNSD